MDPSVYHPRYQETRFTPPRPARATPTGARGSDPDAIPWESDAFPGSTALRLAFKRIGDRKNEHYMNRLSVWATREAGDVAPGGLMCHAELMLLVKPDTWYRFSVNKMSQKMGPDNKTRWEKGLVHGKWVKPQSLDKYTMVELQMSRAAQYNVFMFLKRQMGKPFNGTAYWFNFVFPACALGAVNAGARPGERWYCTQLITAALQASRQPCYQRLDARKQSPNSLYRFAIQLSGAKTHHVRRGPRAV